MTAVCGQQAQALYWLRRVAFPLSAPAAQCAKHWDWRGLACLGPVRCLLFRWVRSGEADSACWAGARSFRRDRLAAGRSMVPGRGLMGRLAGAEVKAPAPHSLVIVGC